MVVLFSASQNKNGLNLTFRNFEKIRVLSCLSSLRVRFLFECYYIPKFKMKYDLNCGSLFVCLKHVSYNPVHQRPCPCLVRKQHLLVGNLESVWLLNMIFTCELPLNWWDSFINQKRAHLKVLAFSSFVQQ